MNSKELRKKFLDFFKKKKHAIVSSSSLLPDDPSVLLTTAGMQQFKRYFTGELDAEKKFNSKNVVSIQKCFRTSDIDEVGDNTHLTFFEMLGNFSFGGYWKEQAIKLAYEFLVNELKLEISHVSVFSPDKIDKNDWRKEVPEDKLSLEIWRKIGVKDIRKEGIDNFWGPTGTQGPCGPTTEIYINNVEVWNIVFNEYYYADRELKKLGMQGIDTGMGFERLATIVQQKSSIYETDLFQLILDNLPQEINIYQKRIIADHLRASVFLLSDGILPSNKDQGYILRKLLRRSLTIKHSLNLGDVVFNNILLMIIKEYGKYYKELQTKKDFIFENYLKEKNKFNKTLKQGLKELDKLKEVNAETAFKLYESYGLPYEVIKDIGKDKAKKLNREDFDIKFQKHQEKSRAGLEKKFGGHGLLLDTGELKALDSQELEKVKKLHTATHLLQSGLRKILGTEVKQAGSDITADRLRFDFTFDRKLNVEEIQELENWINDIIKKDLKVECKEMNLEQAKKTNALGFAFFANKKDLSEKVKIYTIRDSNNQIISSEFCAGPHVARTSGIGLLKIKKQESIGAGLKRIRAILSF